MAVDLDKVAKQLRRNVIAQSTFKEALAGCRLLLAQDEDNDAWSALSTGICVTYMRPFMSSTGLGPLDPKKYEEFPGRPELEHIHNDLKRGRNSVDAHYSPSEAAALLMCPTRRKEQERLRFIREKGEWHVQPPLMLWDMKRLPALMGLIEFQFDRLRIEARSFLNLLEQGKAWPDGLYHLGEDFP